MSAESLAVYGRHRHFVDTLRIGIEQDGCPVFLFVVTAQSVASFRSLLRHLRPLLETLPTWRVLLACPRDFERGAVVCEDAFRRRLDGCSGNPQWSFVNSAQRVERYLLPYAYSHLIPLSSGHAEPKRLLGRVMNGFDDASSAGGQ